ncbi:MAG: hypothetical protein OEY60_00940 [Nitrospira sp.]|nr:hypothetical protein [Nitrospira sp.]
MPPQFLLFCACCQADEPPLEGSEPLRIRHGEFFYCIGGTHADEFILVVHAIYEGGKQCRAAAYDLHHLIGAANGASIATLERI